MNELEKVPMTRHDMKRWAMTGLAILGLVTVLPLIAGTLLLAVKLTLGLLLAAVAVVGGMIHAVVALGVGLIGLAAGLIGALASFLLGPALLIAGIYVVIRVVSEMSQDH